MSIPDLRGALLIVVVPKRYERQHDSFDGGIFKFSGQISKHFGHVNRHFKCGSDAVFAVACFFGAGDKMLSACKRSLVSNCTDVLMEKRAGEAKASIPVGDCLQQVLRFRRLAHVSIREGFGWFFH